MLDVDCRPLGKQTLDSSFYQKEHTKPLFKSYEILAIHNLYAYHSFIEKFKILKFRQLYPLYESFVLPQSVTRSTRHGSTYVSIPVNVSTSHNSFTFKASKIWSDNRIKLKIYDFEVSVNLVVVKAHFKALSIQHKGDATKWNDQNIVQCSDYTVQIFFIPFSVHYTVHPLI